MYWIGVILYDFFFMTILIIFYELKIKENVKEFNMLKRLKKEDLEE